VLLNKNPEDLKIGNQNQFNFYYRKFTPCHRNTLRFLTVYLSQINYYRILLKHIKSLKQKEFKLSSILVEHQSLTQKYIYQNSQMNLIKSQFEEHKKKNEELKLIKNYMELNKKCDKILSEKKDLIQTLEGMKEK